MKTYKFALIFALIISSFIACSDEEENTPVGTDGNGNVVTKVDDGTIEATDSANFRLLLTDSTSKRWTTSLFTLSGSTTYTDCRLDDIMVLFSDGTYDYNGGQLCGAEDNMTNRTGSWELDYSNKKIYFDKGTSEEYEAEVIGLTENELRLKGSYMVMEVRGLYKSN